MQFYFEAEKFLQDDKGSLKSRIFNKKLKSSPTHIYAVVYSTLKYKEHIQYIIKKAKLNQAVNLKKLKVSDNLLMLLVHDFLFSSKGRIQLGKHPIKDAFLQNKTRLTAEFTKLKLKHKAKSVLDLPTNSKLDEDETPVRWFRINTIRIDPDAFFTKHAMFKNLQPVDSIEELAQGKIYKDAYITNLYGLHPREKLTSSKAYENGEVIIQDRASCFPAEILHQDNFDVHTNIIDACAAPGNKTSHCAAHVDQRGSDGVVYAFERDARRVKILKMMSEKAVGAKKNLIHVTHADFTTTKPSDFPDVTGLVVDPSCSGSGIFGRAIEDQEEEKVDVDTERLEKLASFQFSIMKHALSFPGARKVVYSTCSIHAQENERVVVDLLSDPSVKKQGWTLAKRDVVIPSWPKRGWPQEFKGIAENEDQCVELAGGCVRATPKEDGGIGFFAACFVKK